MAAHPLYAGARAIVRRADDKVPVAHGDTDIVLGDADPLQIVEIAVEEDRVYLSVGGDPDHLLYPSYGIKYAERVGGAHNGYMAGQPVRTSGSHKAKVRKSASSLHNCTWIKHVGAGGGVSYQHYYAAVGGRTHPAIDLWLGVDEAGNIVLQAAPFFWRRDVEVPADPVAVDPLAVLQEENAALRERVAALEARLQAAAAVLVGR
jgi:hypothetical protein